MQPVTVTLPYAFHLHLRVQEQKEERQAELEGADQVHWWNPARSCWTSRPAEDDGEELDTAPVRRL